MGLGEHGDIAPLFGIGLQLSHQFFDGRAYHLVKGVFYRERNGGVVDILRGKTEMDELLVLVEMANTVELLLDEIFHCLHVVIGHLLYLLHPTGVVEREIAVNLTECGEERLVEVLELGQRKFA